MSNKCKYILAFIVGVIISFAGIYSADSYLFDSRDVLFDDTLLQTGDENLNEALDTLYNRYTDYTDIKDITIDNPAFHNSVFRGNDITTYYTNGSLYTRIGDGSKFDDLYVGDYIVANNITWRIAGLDILYGRYGITTHHAVIVPDSVLATSTKMCTSTSSAYIYNATPMVKTTLPNMVKNTGIIGQTFGDHLVTYSKNLVSAVDTDYISVGYGTANGASSSTTSTSLTASLMTEQMLTGSNIWSSSNNDVIGGVGQFPLFRLKPGFMAESSGGDYWLSNMARSTQYAVYNGANNHVTAGTCTGTYGVRPYFLIAGEVSDS